MASNNKFNDVAVGYRPQTAFPLNANEYFESLAAAEAAAAQAAEVGTEGATVTSHYIGQTLTVYERPRLPLTGEPITEHGAFVQMARDAVGRNIPVVLVTIKGSVANPSADDDAAVRMAQWLNGDEWRQYVEGGRGKCYFVYGQTAVDQNLFDAITYPNESSNPLLGWYGDGWDADAGLYDKFCVVYMDHDGNLQSAFGNPGGIDGVDDLIGFIDQVLSTVDDGASVSMYQIQPDRTLRLVGQGIQEIAVDDVSIGKDAEGRLYLKAVQDDKLDGSTIYKKSGRIALKSVPESMLTGYGYVKLSALTGYVETAGVKKYGIRTTAAGLAYVDVPWEKGESGPTVEVKVDGDTIGQKLDGTIYLRSVPEDLIGNTGVLFRDWTSQQPAGRIRLLSRGGGWQYYTYSDVSAEQGDNKSLAYRDYESGNTVEPFASNEFLSDSADVVALNVEDGNVLKIANSAFINTDLSSVDCRGVLSVGELAFSGCDYLASAKFQKAEQIQEGAFSQCRALNSIECPRVLEIGPNAFHNCASLVSADFPNLQKIDGTVFDSCISLASINCRNVISVGSGAFSGCEDLTGLTLYSATHVAPYMFSGCRSLNSVYMPASSGDIPIKAFYGCVSLPGIGVAGISRVGDLAFYGCASLSGVKSEGITEIKEGAFAYCSSISSMNLPGVNSIGVSAFAYCAALSSITLSGAWDADKVPAVYADSFDAIPQTVSVYVPDGMKEEFEAKSQWATLEQAETDGHKKVSICELEFGAGGTSYTDAQGNRLDDVVLMRDVDGDVLRDLM